MKLHSWANWTNCKRAAKLAVLILLIVIGYFSIQGDKTVYVQKLPDGSLIRIHEISAGKKVRTFYGSFWQKPLFVMFENILPPKVRGYGKSYLSSFEGGSVGLEFAHPTINPIGNASQLIIDATNAISGACRSYHVLFEPQSGSAAGIVLYSLWEFPRVPDKNLRVKYFPNTNSTEHVEFSIPNPLPL